MKKKQWTNIKCPSYHFNKLYNFDFEEQSNLKYQCNISKRQFPLCNNDNLSKMNYPRYPKCDKDT